MYSNLVDDQLGLADIAYSVVGYVETVVVVVDAPEIVVAVLVDYVETVVAVVPEIVVVVPEIVVVLETVVHLGGPGVHGREHYLEGGLPGGTLHVVMKD
jgi:hypothetical protein